MKIMFAKFEIDIVISLLYVVNVVFIWFVCFMFYYVLRYVYIFIVRCLHMFFIYFLLCANMGSINE